MSSEPRFWNSKQAAAYIGVSLPTLRAYIRRRSNDAKSAPRITGRPPPVRKFGSNRIRFPVEEFKEWAEGPYAQKYRKQAQ